MCKYLKFLSQKFLIIHCERWHQLGEEFYYDQERGEFVQNKIKPNMGKSDDDEEVIPPLISPE